MSDAGTTFHTTHGQPAHGSRLSVGIDWIIRGLLESESGADLLLASQSEPVPGLRHALKQFESELDESGVAVEYAESDAVVAGLIRAGLRARRRVVGLFEVRGVRQAIDALDDACSITVSPRSGGVIVACHSRWTPPPSNVAPMPLGHGWTAPRSARQSDPRILGLYLGIPVLIPATGTEARQYLNEAMRLSRAAAAPTMLYLSPAIMGGGETESSVFDSADRPVHTVGESRETSGRAIHVEARRRRLDRVLNTPLPGEIVPLGLITIGTSHTALRHALYELGLVGRIPILKLAYANPIDQRSVELILTRCEQVIVIEGGSPVVENEVLAIARQLRDRHTTLARVHGRTTAPGAGDFTSPAWRASVELHPSEIIDQLGEVLINSQSGAMVQQARECRDVLAQRAAEFPSIAGATTHRFGRTSSLVHRLVHFTLKELKDVLGWPTGERPAIEMRLETLDQTSFEDSPGTRRVIVFQRRRMPTLGRAAIVHAIRRRHDSTFVILPDSQATAANLDATSTERLARSMIGEHDARRVTVYRLNPAETTRLRSDLEQAILSPGVSIVIVDPPQIKRVGVGEREPPTVDADEPEELRETVLLPASDSPLLCDAWLVRHGWHQIDHLDGLRAPRIEWPDSDDPIETPLDGWIGFEEIRIHRKRPTTDELSDAPALPPPSTPRHGHETTWRAHLCGRHIGQVQSMGSLLAGAGRHMGYRVQVLHGRGHVGAFTNVVFTRPEPDQPPQPVTAHIPYGCANLILSLDMESLADALESDGPFRVACPGRTALVLDLSPADPDVPSESAATQVVVPGELNRIIAPIDRVVLRAREQARRLLRGAHEPGALLTGAAMQRGFIPVTLASLTSSALNMEATGRRAWKSSIEFGRSMVAGLAGRDTPSLRPPSKPESLIRRHAATMKRSVNPRRRARAVLFDHLAIGTLDAITGLRRRDPDRSAERRFVARLVDCEVWGSLPLASLYAQLIADIYAAERSPANYPVTRLAIDELARALLIGDVAFIAATMRRRDRLRRRTRSLAIDRGAGEAFRQRVRGPITQPWLRGIAGEYWSLGPLGLLGLTALSGARSIPWWHRGNRDYRAWVIALCRQCAADLPEKASVWLEVFRQLGRVRGHTRQRAIQILHVRGAVQSLLDLVGPAMPTATTDSAAADAAGVRPTSIGDDAS